MDGGGCGTIAADGDIDDSYFSDNDDENIYDNKNDDNRDNSNNNNNDNNNNSNSNNNDNNNNSNSNNNNYDNNNNDNDNNINNNNNNNNNNNDKNKNHPLPNPKPQPTLQNKYKKMTEGLCDVLSDFGLISFLPMNIQDGEVRQFFNGNIFLFIFIFLFYFYFYFYGGWQVTLHFYQYTHLISFTYIDTELVIVNIVLYFSILFLSITFNYI